MEKKLEESKRGAYANLNLKFVPRITEILDAINTHQRPELIAEKLYLLKPVLEKTYIKLRRATIIGYCNFCYKKFTASDYDFPIYNQSIFAKQFNCYGCSLFTCESCAKPCNKCGRFICPDCVYKYGGLCSDSCDMQRKNKKQKNYFILLE